MVFNLLHRRNSQTSTCSSSSSSSSSSSTSSFYSPLEPVVGDLPHELYERQPTLPSSKKKNSKSSKCSLDVEKDSWSNPFSFPRSHTHHHVCPKHGIRHDPFLALPGRDARSFEERSYDRGKKVPLRKTKSMKSETSSSSPTSDTRISLFIHLNSNEIVKLP
ncbi:hypothetical protein JCM5353_000767 [Sporobolomyces roseus]